VGSCSDADSAESPAVLAPFPKEAFSVLAAVPSAAADSEVCVVVVFPSASSESGVVVCALVLFCV